MALFLIDYVILMIKCYYGLYLLKDFAQGNFARSRSGLARYNRYSLVFYLQGLFKLLLVDTAFLTPGNDSVSVISVPVYSLTVIYFGFALVFMPMLRRLLMKFDESHATQIVKERQDSEIKEVKT